MNGLALTISRHRRKRGIAQTAAAAEVGWTQAKWSRLEQGQSKPYKDVPVLAEWLGISVDRALKLLDSPAGVEKDLLDLQAEVAGLTDLASDALGRIEARLERLSAIVDELVGSDHPGAVAVGSALRQHRAAHGWSPAELSVELGVPAAAIRWIEEGTFSPWGHRAAIARVLGVEVKVLEAVLCGESAEDIEASVVALQERVAVGSMMHADAARNIEIGSQAITDVAESCVAAKEEVGR